MADYDFSIIRPIEITDAILTSSNVPEATQTAYSAGTTYGSGTLVGEFAAVNGQPQAIYQSLQAGNLGNTPASSPTFWRFLANVYPVYSGAVTYALGDIVSSISTNVHLLYESLAAGNLGNPLTDATKWLHLGSPNVTTGLPYNSTNRWKMFDQSSGSQTANGGSITLTLTPGVIVNAAAFINIRGVSITVSQSISGYSETKSLTSHPVNNWYDWYYEELIEEDKALFTDIPPYAASVLTITITAATGSTAACGVAVIGKMKQLGTTQWGLASSIDDYSRVVENTFGDIELRRGAYSERMNLDVHIEAGSEGEVFRQMKDHRAEPLIFVGSSAYAHSVVYGFIKSWQMPTELTGGIMPVEIKGLT
jgi:hypothetical protein